MTFEGYRDLQLRGSVLPITTDRPDKLNATGVAMLAELSRASMPPHFLIFCTNGAERPVLQVSPFLVDQKTAAKQVIEGKDFIRESVVLRKDGALVQVPVILGPQSIDDGGRINTSSKAGT